MSEENKLLLPYPPHLKMSLHYMGVWDQQRHAAEKTTGLIVLLYFNNKACIEEVVSYIAGVYRPVLSLITVTGRHSWMTSLVTQ